MTQAHPLRGLAGLANPPCARSDSALLMIDCQNTYREGVMTLVGVEEALAEAARLLERARNSGAKIFHIAHDSGPGSPYDYSAPIGQIADPVAPGDGEPVIIKNRDYDVAAILRMPLKAQVEEHEIIADPTAEQLAAAQCVWVALPVKGGAQ